MSRDGIGRGEYYENQPENASGWGEFEGSPYYPEDQNEPLPTQDMAARDNESHEMIGNLPDEPDEPPVQDEVPAKQSDREVPNDEPPSREIADRDEGYPVIDDDYLDEIDTPPEEETPAEPDDNEIAVDDTPTQEIPVITPPERDHREIDDSDDGVEHETAEWDDQIPDVAPSVSFDVRFRNIAENLDLDLPYLTDYLRSRGLSDELIQGLSIEFSATVTLDDPDSSTAGIEGQYLYEQRKCRVYLANITLMVINAAKKGQESEEWADDNIQSEAIETLAHEVEHYVEHAEVGFVKPEGYIGWQSDSDDTAYREQPGEVRARAAEKLYDTTRLRMS